MDIVTNHTDNNAVTSTSYPGHEVGTYKAYKTIGGSVINFLGVDGQLRGMDGGKIYPSHKNAQARARQLNHPIKHAMKRYDMCEAYHDGYTACIRKDEDAETFKDAYNLSVRQGEMPPHYSQDFETIEEVEKEMRDHSFFPATVAWKAVKPEEI
jgi:hypothetical protein